MSYELAHSSFRRYRVSLLTHRRVIDRNRWLALQPLLDQVLDIAPAERSRWLDALSAESPGVAEDLASLLAGEAAAERSGFLDRQLDITLAGLEFGAYRLERPLGQGGMGTVWLARRVDGRFEGTAAVKILNLALLSATGQERFRQEGSVLARLAHPGIARLLDAGLSGAGQPYLVLEYVEGLAIDEFADQNRLPLEGRIRLVLQVLAAVGHAHSHLIVHRDLKPSNILVTAEGAVKLLDFGIAKLLDDGTGERAALTADGGRMLTPEFAAPEQVRGDRLTTAVDVYSLGVLLYLLVSGRHPTNQGSATPVDGMRAVLEVEPTPLGLADLDNVLDKALRKSPEDRYPTVAAFAADLERYLRHEPVSARPHSRLYRLRKFIRRNRTGLFAGSMTAAGLIAATIFSVAQMRYARQQRDDARAQRDNAVYHERRAAASSGFMEFLLQTIAPTGQAYTMEELLDKARELLERDYRGDPRFMARMMVELGDHYFELHDRRRELPLLSRAEELAVASNDMETAGYASCRLAKSAADDSDVRAAEGALARADGYLARIRGSAEGPLVQCLRARSALARLQGRTTEALAYARRAVAIGRASGDTLSHYHRGAINEVARALHDDGNIRGSLDVTRTLIAVNESTGRGRTLASVVERYNEAALLSRLGEKRQASAALARTIELASGINPEKRVPIYVAMLAGDLANDLGMPDSAIRTYRRALADSKKRDDASYRVRALSGLVSVLLDQKRVYEAKESLEELSSITPEKQRWRLGLLGARLAYIQGSTSQARHRYMELLAERGFPGKGISTPYFSSLVLDASIMAWNSGDVAAAESLAVHARRLGEDEGQDGGRSGSLGYTGVLIARARRHRGDSAAARDILKQSMAPLENGYGPSHPRTLEARALLDTLGHTAARRPDHSGLTKRLM
jgi:eukaryotic-like serine/threonine-protein kinase